MMKSRRATAVLYVLLTAIALLLNVSGAYSSQLTASATLNRASFPVNEHAQLMITVNGTRSAELQIPEIKDFTIHQRGRSTQINMVNGAITSSITISCIIEPFKAGKFTIPAIRISADGEDLETEPIPFEVTATTSSQPLQQPPQPTTGGSPTIAAGEATTFIKLIRKERTTYIGEIIPVEIRAYFRQGLRVNLNSTPVIVGDGLVMPQLHDQPVQTQEYIDGVIYNVLSWTTAFTNIKEGSHNVHLELEATQLVPQRRTSTSMFGSRSPFDDDLFDSFFGGGYRQIPFKVFSEEFVHTVAPLPEDDRPSTFSGAIGDFTLIASVEPQQVEVGEPMTLKMTVGGTGNFDRVDPPVFPDIPGWKTYEATAEFFGQKNASHSGKKVFEQAIVAQVPGLSEIPSLVFSYFDSEKGLYITRKTPPIPISITGGSAAPTAATTPATSPTTAAAPAPPEQPTQQDSRLAGLAPIHLEPGTPVEKIAPLYTRLAVIVFIALCLLIIAGVALIRLQRSYSAKRPERMDKSQRERQLKSALAHLSETIESDNGPLFLSTARNIIQNHLGSIWNCKPATITRANLIRRIPNQAALVEILTVAESSAYGSCQLDKETMESYLKQIGHALEELS